ncbi:hypothetical protein ABIA30_004898 [Mycobacterium sp. MAA66]|uniref:hypothetical protein n=1 Tax=Mycobacterium sp. MAA66 TaxID=3156297 RepID=UPI0035172672
MSGPIQPSVDQWSSGAVSAVPSQPQPAYQQQYQYQHPQYQQPQSYPPPAHDPIFQITTMTHTGLMVFWFNQRQVVRGTYAQCAAALRSAQTHNLVLGWWSFLSILLMNWIAISHNSSARKKLESDAQQAQAYAQWWHQYVGPSRA